MWTSTQYVMQKFIVFGFWKNSLILSTFYYLWILEWTSMYCMFFTFYWCPDFEDVGYHFKKCNQSDFTLDFLLVPTRVDILTDIFTITADPPKKPQKHRCFVEEQRRLPAFLRNLTAVTEVNWKICSGYRRFGEKQRQLPDFYSKNLLLADFLMFIILHHIYSIEAKSSAQMGHIRRFPYPMLANCVHAKRCWSNLFTFFTVKFCFYKIIANLS